MNPELLLISGECFNCDLDPAVCLNQGFCIYEYIDTDIANDSYDTEN